MQNGVPPSPVLFTLFIHNEVRLFLGHPTAGHHEFPHLAIVFFDFGGEKQGGGCDRVVVEAGFVGLGHGMAHEEPMQIDRRRAESQLRKFQHDADLSDEVNTFLPVGQLVSNGHALENTGSPEEFLGREEPLGLGAFEDMMR